VVDPLFLPFLDASLTANDHARIVNTLSFMEYQGARKIFKSQDEHAMDEQILSHAAEEARHALVFKRIALKLDPSQTTYDYIIRNSYMQTVDAASAHVHRALAYCLTTIVVEERALAFYPLYADVLDRFALGHGLRAIVREEGGHLEDLFARLGQHNTGLLQTVRAAEANAFAAFSQAVAQTSSRSEPSIAIG
jgi:hypothetical protein